MLYFDRSTMMSYGNSALRTRKDRKCASYQLAFSNF